MSFREMNLKNGFSTTLNEANDNGIEMMLANISPVMKFWFGFMVVNLILLVMNF